MKLLGRPSRQWLLVGLLGAAVVLSVLGPGVSRMLRGVANSVLAPFGEGGMYMATTIEGRAGELSQRAISPAEARRLAEVNRELRGRLQAVEGELGRMVRQQTTLRNLYTQIPYGQWELIPARVVAVGSLPYGQVRVVAGARGAAAGAQVTTRRLMTDRSKRLPSALATISATALVGELTSAGAFTAELRLITDKSFETPAKILRVIDPDNPRKITVTKGEEAIERPLTPSDPIIDVWAQGDGADGMIVREASAYDNIRVGDWLLTSGAGRKLPARIRIGRVVEVTRETERRGLFVSLRIAPHADLGALREVYIVLPVGLARTPSETDR